MNRTVRNQQQGLWLQRSFNAQIEVNATQQMIGSLIERSAQSLARARRRHFRLVVSMTSLWYRSLLPFSCST